MDAFRGVQHYLIVLLPSIYIIETFILTALVLPSGFVRSSFF